jgi:hypothetical protein
MSDRLKPGQRVAVYYGKGGRIQEIAVIKPKDVAGQDFEAGSAMMRDNGKPRDARIGLGDWVAAYASKFGLVVKQVDRMPNMFDLLAAPLKEN